MTKLKNLTRFIRRTLSRLALFDLVSIISIGLVILVAAFFFLRQQEWIEIEAKVSPTDFFWSDKKPPYWLANSVYLGDYELDGLGRKAVEVLAVRIYDAPNDKKNIYLRLKLQAIRDQRKNQYQFKNKPLAIGAPIDLKLTRTFLSGVVTYVKGIPDSRVWEEKVVESRLLDEKSVFPETQGIEPWMAESLSVGDKVKDGQGLMIAEILDKQTKPADKIVTTIDGKVYLAQDPIKKDIILILKLRAYKQGDTDYFLDEFKVKVGSKIFLSFPKVDVWPEVTKIIK